MSLFVHLFFVVPVETPTPIHSTCCAYPRHVHTTNPVSVGWTRVEMQGDVNAQYVGYVKINIVFCILMNVSLYWTIICKCWAWSWTFLVGCCLLVSLYGVESCLMFFFFESYICLQKKSSLNIIWNYKDDVDSGSGYISPRLGVTTTGLFWHSLFALYQAFALRSVVLFIVYSVSSRADKRYWGDVSIWL